MNGNHLLLLLSALFLCSCKPPEAPQRELFDMAEYAYQHGHYAEAGQYYERFLAQNPDPQLARLAERRSLSIEREIETVMGKKNAPRPIYLNSDIDTDASNSKKTHMKTLKNATQ